MGSAKQHIEKLDADRDKLHVDYKTTGSTYKLIVSISDLALGSLRVTHEVKNTKIHQNAINVNEKIANFRRMLISEISMNELIVLAKHGNTDADWLIASKIADENSEEFESGDGAKRTKIWKKYIHHLEKGVHVYKMNASSSERMIFLSDQLTSGLEPDLEAAINYLKLASELGTVSEAGEAEFRLWSLYLDELNDKDSAQKHLLTSVNYRYPEALAAYGRAHWGDWLVEEDERKAFLLINESAQLLSQWGSELLATCYDLGLGTKKNAPKAFKLRLSLGEDYSSDVCCELANHYLVGNGTPKNSRKGNRLVEKAMSLGNGKAHWIAADNMKFSKNSKKLDEKRFIILRDAFELEQPYELTFIQLGYCYFFGVGTKQDFGRAAECYQKLLEIGSIENAEAEAELMLEALAGGNPEENLATILAKETD